MQVDAAVEAARKAAQPARKTFAIGFQTGHEMNWLPRAMHVLRDELTNIQVTVSSDYSPDLAEALAALGDVCSWAAPARRASWLALTATRQLAAMGIQSVQVRFKIPKSYFASNASKIASVLPTFINCTVL
jgi:DNA-binding transcriptional LysR family regulator